MDCKEEGVAAGSELYVDGDMEIFVKSLNCEIMTFKVYGSVKVLDVMVTMEEAFGIPIDQIRLFFRGYQMESDRTLAEYSVEDRSVIHYAPRFRGGGGCHMELPTLLTMEKIRITDQPLVIWEKKYDITLLDLMVKHTRNGGKNGEYFTQYAWHDIMGEFRAAIGLRCNINDLENRLKFYKNEYQIVSNLRKHPKFSWDDKNHSVIATDAEWNEYIMENRGAKAYRKRQIPYFDQLEIICSS
ncbi:L10-interacting MYB domain-containing protein-like isoform X2 [Ananas comosus]|uniref:L10-interacting MYB domain-containing protein-like isoform X2 n=1 Tax=Ananas comosus TaxID=4615 RepID=A0A6P5EVV8_ANACO|nr:L10-interacting MYB domain-containing protein-like isoform X2 [Ananas comosus]